MRLAGWLHSSGSGSSRGGGFSKRAIPPPAPPKRVCIHHISDPKTFATFSVSDIRSSRRSVLEIEIFITPQHEPFTMKTLSYRILLQREPEGGYTVTVPSLPGCVTYGDTIDESIEMAREAIELYIESLVERGEEIPTSEGMLEYVLNIEAQAQYA